MRHLDDAGGITYDYAKIPKDLIRQKTVSPMSILLYGLILDRYGLSCSQGDNWKDSSGQIYVIFTIKEVCDLLWCKHDKASALLKELEQAMLIRRRKQGRGLPDRIYPTAFCNPDYSSSVTLKNSSQAFGKTDTNNTYTNNTDSNHTTDASTFASQRSLEENFSKLWTAYPQDRRGNRQQALEVFRAKITSENDAAQTIANLQLWKRSEQWRKNGGQYIPFLHNWLARDIWNTRPSNMATPYGASGELGDAELEAIRRVLSDNMDQQ